MPPAANLNTAFRLIKEVQKRFRTREAEERERQVSGLNPVKFRKKRLFRWNFIKMGTRRECFNLHFSFSFHSNSIFSPRSTQASLPYICLLFSSFSNVCHSACVWPTALKLGCIANFDMLFLVMGFISFVDEITFMLISNRHFGVYCSYEVGGHCYRVVGRC